jgi:uncharacterized membrane protein YkoI
MISRLLIPFVLSCGLLFATSVAAITLEDAARKAARQYDAKVLSAKTVSRQGRRIHEIKVLTKDGTVKTVRIAEDSS